MEEGLLDEAIQGGNGALLVEAISRRIESEVDLHCAVGRAQVPCSNMQASDKAQSRGVAEYVVPPGGCMRLLGDAGRHAGRLAPGTSSSTQVSPPLVGDEVVEGGEVGGVRIDVPKDESRPTSPQLVVADDSLDNGVGSRGLGGVAMRAAVAIDVVPMAKTSSFALAMVNKLSPAQLDILGKLLAASIKWEASISGKGNNADASTWLTVIGVRRSAEQLSFEL